jgi:uncharacterized protein (DUF1501 family)
VVTISDFGRTPNINRDAGRDHWSYCYTVMLAGAGIRGGTVYGASDRHAAFVRDNPISPADICATIYECLGIDVGINFPSLLTVGDPSVVPATRIILNPRLKKAQ